MGFLFKKQYREEGWVKVGSIRHLWGKLNMRGVVQMGLLGVYAFLVFLICFWGQVPIERKVLVGEVSKLRIVSEIDFEYESGILMERNVELAKKRVPPVYMINRDVFDVFEGNFRRFWEQLEEVSSGYKEKRTEEERGMVLKGLSAVYQDILGEFVGEEDMRELVMLDKEKRKRLYEEGVRTLKEIEQEGIFDSVLEGSEEGHGVFFKVQVGNQLKDIQPRSEKEALRYLSINLATLDMAWEGVRAGYRVMKAGIKPNIHYDGDESEILMLKAIEKLRAVVIEVKKGQSIVEPGAYVTHEQMEQLKAYTKELEARGEKAAGVTQEYGEKLLLTMALIVLTYIYVSLQGYALNQKRKVVLHWVLLLMSVGIARVVLQLDQWGVVDETSLVGVEVLPYLVPIGLGPLLLVGLTGHVRPGITMGNVCSAFYGLMLDNVMPYPLMGVFAIGAGLFFCKGVLSRVKLMQSAMACGGTAAVWVMVASYVDKVGSSVWVPQVIGCIVMGFITGVLVIGLLPVFESLFKCTSDITLLELTDYNHPLLRRLQEEAPGTYHHSIMVAALAEQAARVVGASPLLCRVGSLFHDVGKVVKPEYFIENQGEGVNPHSQHNPNVSALIIKQHVKEGVALGKEYGLPKVLIDIIQQHHGTTLIYYFYEKAMKNGEQQEFLFNRGRGGGEREDGGVDETSFRYEGPKPGFKESLLVMLADSIEAASRGLKKVTLGSVREMVERVFEDKVNDGQMEECTVSFKELRQLRELFIKDVFKMLHMRIGGYKGGREVEEEER